MVRAVAARVRGALETFWVLPGVAILLAAAFGVLLPLVDREVAVPGGLAFGGQEDTARAVLTAIIALCVSVAGVSFSVIAVALVLASQQLSPRVLRSFQRQRLNQAVLAVLLGTATFALFVLGNISDAKARPVPELSMTVAMLLAATALALFTLFLHHVVRSLNASAVIRRIAADGHESIATAYPVGAGSEPRDVDAAEAAAEDAARCTHCIEVRAPRAGYIASVDGAAIVAWARAKHVFVEQRRAIGNFALTGSVLAVVHADAVPDGGCSAVAGAFYLEEERMVDGDIAFPIRQLADIALKGLSPGINDPTTAENAMDSVADTLVRFAQRGPVSPLRTDEDDVPRLRALTPSFDQLVMLGFDEVRRDAAGRPTSAVRLLELLADLRQCAGKVSPSAEIDRQAQLIADQAAYLADHEADQQLVIEAHQRLHHPAAVDA